MVRMVLPDDTDWAEPFLFQFSEKYESL